MVKVSDTLFGFEIIKCVAIGFISNETNHTTRHEKACNTSGNNCTNLFVFNSRRFLLDRSHNLFHADDSNLFALDILS